MATYTSYTTYKMTLPKIAYKWPSRDEMRQKEDDRPLPPVIRTSRGYDIDIGDEFRITVPNMELLEKHNLLGQGLLHFTNELCSLFDDLEENPEDREWKALDATIRRLMIGYENGEIYYHLIEKHGVEALNFNAWFHFAGDMRYEVCLQTFTDMPTDVLEEYGRASWKRRVRTLGEVGIKHVLSHISAREDMYGNLPSDLVFSLLFEQ